MLYRLRKEFCAFLMHKVYTKFLLKPQSLSLIPHTPHVYNYIIIMLFLYTGFLKA